MTVVRDEDLWENPHSRDDNGHLAKEFHGEMRLVTHVVEQNLIPREGDSSAMAIIADKNYCDSPWRSCRKELSLYVGPSTCAVCETCKVCRKLNLYTICMTVICVTGPNISTWP